MAYQPANINGQAPMANSAPVVIASNQTAVPITGSQSAVSTASWTSATALNTALTISVTNLNTVTVAIATTSTFTGGIVSFEVSPDNTNWFPIAMAPIDRFGSDTSYTFVASTGRAWSTSTDGFTNFRVRLSTVITGTGTATILVTAQLFAIEPLVTTGQVQRNTYRGATTAVLVTAVTANVPFLLLQGSSTKTIRVQKITLSGLTLTAVAYLNINVAKYSTAATGGTSTALTRTPVDSQSPASSAASLAAYTVGPTAGTKVGDVATRRNLGQATTAAAAGIPENIEFNFFDNKDGSSVILRGTAEGIGVYWAVAPASAVSMMAQIEWTEE